MRPAYDLFCAKNPGPVCIAVPHGGRDYPAEIAPVLAMPLARARGIEDRYVDLLADEAIARGHCTLVARTPRLLIDLNRAETDIDPATVEGCMVHGARPTYRARGGLGLIPDRLPGAGALWRRRVDLSTLADRIAKIHRPYHAALAKCLGSALRAHGHVIMIDLHSMPPLTGHNAASVVIGDLNGIAAGPEIVDAAQALFERNGLRVARNIPYAGGYVLERHARPLAQVHAIQVEIDRRLYLDSRLDTPGPGVARLAGIIADLADMLAALRPESTLPIAAE